MILKQKEIFNKLGDKNSKEMTELNNEVSPDDLKYRYKSSTADTKCNEFDDARSLIHEVRKGETSLSNVKKDLNQS